MILHGQSLTAQTFNNDVLLIRSSQSNCVLEKAKHSWKIIVYRKILAILLFIYWFIDLRLQKFGTPFSVFLDVVFDNVCGREINHVVLDGDVCTLSVNLMIWRVVDEQDFDGKVVDELFQCGLLRFVGALSNYLHFIFEWLQGFIKTFEHCLISLFLFLDFIQNFLVELIKFLLNFDSLFNVSVFDSQENSKFRRSNLLDEFPETFMSCVGVTIKYEFWFDGRSLGFLNLF